MLVFPYEGDAYLTLKYSGSVLSSAVSLDPYVIKPTTNYYIHFHSGQNAGLVDGVTLTGQTSGGVIKADRVLITSGSTGSSNAVGVLFCEHLSDNKIVSGENLRVSTTTYCVAHSPLLSTPFSLSARALFLTVETNSLRISYSGVPPTSGSGTPASFGHLVASSALSSIRIISSSSGEDDIVLNNTFRVSGWKSVKDFKMIANDTSNIPTVTITVYY